MKPYEYAAHDVVSTSALAEWNFESFSSCETTVLPDGCQDLIVQYDSYQGHSWFLSELSHSAYTVPSTAGARMRGLRLQPGVRLQHADLCAWAQTRDPHELFDSDQVNEFCIKSNNLTVALECLASDQRTVQCVANDLGVSLRSLQRLIKSETGQSPYYWFSLARVRRAGRSLVDIHSLSDAALESGFADQAHMNREVRKWFGLTPNQIRNDKDLLGQLFEPGYG